MTESAPKLETESLTYPHATGPDPGRTVAVADGVYWLRMPLPFSLEFINLYLLDDGDGWTLIDTGLGDQKTLALWSESQHMLQGKPIHRVLVTHLHPDHVGCAGWLCDHFDAPLLMSRGEYFQCAILLGDTGRPAPKEALKFYRRAGFDQEALDRYQKRFGTFGNFVEQLPRSYTRLKADDRLTMAGREWRVVVGSGHSPEHVCLWCEDDGLFISGDQILPRISSNVSVWPIEPEANPLGEWLDSCARLRDLLPGNTLVLPSHNRPFVGAGLRLSQLIDEHTSRLDKLLELCSQPQRAVDVFPVLFKRPIGAGDYIMATGESLAHLHWLWLDGKLSIDDDADGVRYFTTS